jgi:hypothetical protein
MTSRTHYKTLIETTYLGQWDFPPGREATVEIESVERFIPRSRRKGQKNDRLMIGFRGKKKRWLAGPVSQAVIEAMFGNYIEDWTGKKITLYVDANVSFGRRRIGGVRVRPMAATGPLTDDPLDNEVDADKVQEIAEAFCEEEGVK